MIAQVSHAILTGVPTTDHDHMSDPSVVNQLGAHHTGLSGDHEHGALGRDARRGAVADDVHLGVMAPDLHPRPRNNPLLITQTGIPTAKLATTARAAVITIHEDDVALGIEQERAKLAPWTVGRLGEREALLDTNGDMLLFHDGSSDSRSSSRVSSLTHCARARRPKICAFANSNRARKHGMLATSTHRSIRK